MQAPDLAVDLGSGAGIPGLALALAWPASAWAFVEGSATRAAHLEEAVAELELADRVTVVALRAELAAREERWRGRCALVVARSFGPPAVTAECASGFLRQGGRLLVSEPPVDVPDRWSSSGLGELGLQDEGRVGAVRVLVQGAPTPDRYPRRVGVPTKRPLW